MKVTSNSVCCTETTKPAFKYPGIYRDTRDGEIILMLNTNYGLVLKASNGCGYPYTGKQYLAAGSVRNCVLSKYDELHSGSFTIQND